MYYTQEQIDRANQADLVSFLQSQGEQLTRAGNEYRWKRHDSLTVRGNKWYRHSQSKGGGPVDFLMEFFGKSFTEAVELLTGEKGAAPPPDSPAPLSDFRLPPRSPTAEQVKRYLTEARRIDEDVTGFFISSGDIYEEAAHHNAVFVGRDESGIPRYAHQRGTAGSFRLDVKGSDKAFNFCYRGEGERLFVFEAPIDLLSFLCLFKKEWQKQSYLALGGVGEKALLRFLSDRPNIKTVYLCLDSDQAGNDASHQQGVISSPFSGVISNVEAEVGTESTQTFCTIYDTSKGYLFACELPAAQASDCQTGLSAVIKQGDQTETAAITAISENAENDTVDITIQLTATDWKVGPADAEIVLSEQDYDLCLPNTAIHQDNQGDFVFAVEEKNTVLGTQNVLVRIPVTVLEVGQSQTSIEGAILPEDSIVVQSTRSLEAGSKVRVKNENA